MAQRTFVDIKAYVGFSAEDADRLRELGPVVRPMIADVVDLFYERVLSHAGTRRVLKGGEKQIERLKTTLSQWLDALFGGDYGDDYCRSRLAIGRAHVRVGLPQAYMVAAMDVLWRLLEERLRNADVPDLDAKLRSLHKLLTLETSLMLETYKESYSEQIREIERAAVRDQLHQAEHLAHIGRLAASLAHEIKNPLAGISGAIQVIREPLPEEHPHRPILTEILRQIDRLDGTVKDLLVYARPRPPRFTRCNLSKLIDRVLTVLRAEPEIRRVRIVVVASKKLDLYGDEAQLEQMLINLLLNAAQASADGQRVQLAVTSNADGLRLVVEDEGQGMEEDILRQAFEPFYTTKSKGTGLGLPICRKIVEAHGGTISIQSERGVRTSVAVRLPRFPPASSGGNETDEYSHFNC